jgi:hypothetical protein
MPHKLLEQFQYIIKKHLFQISGIIFFLLILNNINGQQISEYEAKSAFLLKITNFIDWPESVNKQMPDFTILVLGEDPIEKILTSKLKGPEIKIKNKKVIIRRILSIQEINNCQILFISSSEKYELNKILKAVKKLPILTIGDTDGFAERGVMINMFVEESLNFKANKKIADESGIYISSKLLVHAKKVIQ